MISNSHVDNSRREISVIDKQTNKRCKFYEDNAFLLFLSISAQNINYVQRFYRAISIYDFEQK